MNKASKALYSAAFILTGYHAILLFCMIVGPLFFKQAWTEWGQYMLYPMEPITWPAMIAFLPLVHAKPYVGTLTFAVYAALMLGTSLFLFAKKSWARKVTVIFQGARICLILLYFGVSLWVQSHAHAPASIWKIMGMNTVCAGLVFLAPSLFCWIVLTRPSVKKEFVS